MSLLSLIGFVLALTTRCIAGEVPVRSYVSRPDILAPDVTINTVNKEYPHKFDQSSVDHSYLFVSTCHATIQSAPYIFDWRGELVWSGYDPAWESDYFALQAHHLPNGTSLLTVFRGHKVNDHGKGHVAFLDEHYNVYKTISAKDVIRVQTLDYQEFQLLDHGRAAIVLSYEPLASDLTFFGIYDTAGWVLDSVFVVLDLERDNEVIFEWHASHHIPINETTADPFAESETGRSYHSAFDFFHLNSVSMFNNGDYLLSSRNTDTIYRISGKTGGVIWRLGGSNSSFVCKRFTFSAQYDARVIMEDPTDGTVVISLFDNAYNNNGNTKTSATPSVLFLSLSIRNWTAYPVEQYFPLQTKDHTIAEGSAQRLSSEDGGSGNTIISWGSRNSFSEFTSGGRRVSDISFNDNRLEHYRIYKSNWTGHPPESELAVYSYAYDSNFNMSVWISWNGATEVHYYQIFSDVPTDGQFDENDMSGPYLGVTNRTGFETHFIAPRFADHVWVQALTLDGTVLGKSQVVNTFVPSKEHRHVCGEHHCVSQMFSAQDGGWAAGPIRLGGKGRTTTGMDEMWFFFQTLVIFGLGVVADRMFFARPIRWR